MEKVEQRPKEVTQGVPKPVEAGAGNEKMRVFLNHAVGLLKKGNRRGFEELLAEREFTAKTKEGDNGKISEVTVFDKEGKLIFFENFRLTEEMPGREILN